MTKNINPATGKEWTEAEKREVYGKPIDLSTLSHRQSTPEEVRTRLDEARRLGAIGVAMFERMFRGNEDEPEIKTKYFETYGDYLVAQDKVRRQIEFKHEPVDIDLEQKLIAETKNIRQQRVAFYNSMVKKSVEDVSQKHDKN